MNKPLACSLFAVLSVAAGLNANCSAPPENEADSFTTTLNGASEVPPVESDGSGAGDFTLNEQETELTYSVTASGLSGPVIGAHFHFSPTGPSGAGGIVLDITADVVEENGEVTINGVWDLSAEDVDNLRLGYIYVNLHTDENPGGEIRGNLSEPAEG